MRVLPTPLRHGRPRPPDHDPVLRDAPRRRPHRRTRGPGGGRNLLAHLPGDRRRHGPRGGLRRLHGGPAGGPRRGPRRGHRPGLRPPLRSRPRHRAPRGPRPARPPPRPGGPRVDPPPGRPRRPRGRPVHPGGAGRPHDGGHGPDDLRGRRDPTARGGPYAALRLGRRGGARRPVRRPGAWVPGGGGSGLVQAARGSVLTSWLGGWRGRDAVLRFWSRGSRAGSRPAGGGVSVLAAWRGGGRGRDAVVRVWSGRSRVGSRPAGPGVSVLTSWLGGWRG